MLLRFCCAIWLLLCLPLAMFARGARESIPTIREEIPLNAADGAEGEGALTLDAQSPAEEAGSEETLGTAASEGATGTTTDGTSPDAGAMAETGPTANPAETTGTTGGTAGTAAETGTVPTGTTSAQPSVPDMTAASSSGSSGGRTSIITILNAQKTEYKKDPLSGGEIIEFSGDVIVSVEQGSTTTTIRASVINYSRERDLLYAEGEVSLESTGSTSDQKLGARSLLFNTSTMEGIFDNGTVVQLSDGVSDGSSLIVSSELFGRNRSKAMTFKNGTLTFCEDPNPHWKIRATRIWLLPGNEFAFANALLYVGRVPVFYFPFFYYPKDELIFNPVFGYHPRKGYYFQTTTYFIGRKPQAASTTSGTLSFMQNSNPMKQVREGLILHNLDERETTTPVNSLKLMADYYTNLGGMVGVEGAFRPPQYISSLNFSFALGFTRTLFPINGYATYVTASPSGQYYMDSSAFMGMRLPFRYKMDFSMSLSRPFSLNIRFPLYSDAYFEDDLLTRKETMDWVGFLLNGVQGDDDALRYMTSFQWSLSGSYSVPTLTAVRPYLSSVSTNFSSSLLFSTVTNTRDLPAEVASLSRLPAKRSFSPSTVTPIRLGLTLSGTLFEYPSASRTSSASAVQNSLLVPFELGGSRTDEDETAADAEANTAQGAAQADAAQTEAEQGVLPDSALPAISFSPSSVAGPGGLTYRLSYSISPDFQTQLSYPTLSQADDFDWNNIQSGLITFRSPVRLSSSLAYRDSFISMSNSVNFQPTVQRHPILMGRKQVGSSTMGYTDSYIESIRRNDYAASKLDMDNTNTLSLRPFVYTEHFSQTSVSWNTSVKLLRTEFIGTASDPVWNYKGPEWDESSITTHTVNVNLAAREGNFSQSLLFSSYLPPQTDRYTATLSLTFPYNISMNVGSGVEQRSSTDPSWRFRPVTQNASVSMLNGNISLTQSYSYNVEEKYHESLRLSANVYGLSLNFSMLYTTGYDFDAANGWTLRNRREFLPSYLSLSYSVPSKTFTFRDDTIGITPGLSTSLYYDLLQPTSSYFSFSPSLSFHIDENFTLTFAATSRNDVIFRYMQDIVGFAGEIPGEKNPITDLFNSFAFWDETKRQNSGFKIKSFRIQVTHDLHDWELSSEFEMAPRLIKTGPKPYYDFHPYFSVSVVWKPMSSLKTTVADDYGVFRLNPAE